MKKRSVWAKNHKRAARLIIILSFVTLTFLGILTGNLLTDLNIILSTNTFFFISILFCTGLLLYPSKGLRRKYNARAFYIRQKSCDALLAASTFCMLIFAGNQPEQIFRHFQRANATETSSILVVPKDSSLKKYNPINEFSASMKDANGNLLKWKERKKLLKEQVRSVKKNPELSEGGKVALIILSVLVALGLIFLVSALACNLSCNGAEGAAVLVGIGGTALIIFLLIITIRGITGKRRRKKTIEDVKPEI